MRLRQYLDQPESKTLDVKKSVAINGKIFCVGSDYRGRESPIAIIGDNVYLFDEDGMLLDILVDGDNTYMCGTIESALVPYVGFIVKVDKCGNMTKTSHCFSKFLCFKELSIKDNNVVVSGEYYLDSDCNGKITVVYDTSLNILSRHIEGSLRDDEI